MVTALHDRLPVKIPVAAQPAGKVSYVDYDSITFLKKAKDALNTLKRRLDDLHGAVPSLGDAVQVYDIVKDVEVAEHELKETLAAEPMSYEIAEEGQKRLSSLHEARTHIRSHEALSGKLSAIRKWIEAGYDRKIIETDPEAVLFAAESDLLFSIQMYKDAASTLRPADMDLKVVDGKVYIKVLRTFRPYASMKEMIVFNPVTKKFNGWSYRHPDGFVPVDTLEWETLEPCAQLSQDALKNVRKTAENFWKNYPEVDRKMKKPCVLQVVCTEGSKFLPDTPVLTPLNQMLPRHVRIRMIDDTGKVYSFSTKMTKEDEDFVLGYLRFGDGFGFSLRTADAKIVSPDYEESRKFFHADMASIPMTKERFNVIKNTVERMNQKGGIRFCFSKQNCCRFSQEILKLAGVEVDTKMYAPSFFYRILPGFQSIPLIGKYVAAVAQTVSFVVEKIFATVVAMVPRPIVQVIGWVKTSVTYIPRKIGVLCCSLFFRLLGGHQFKNSKMKDDLEEHANHTKRLVHFKRLLGSLPDYFDEEATAIYHSRLMVEWIRRQGSYTFFDNRTSGLVLA